MVERVSGKVAGYISEQRDRFLPRAEPMSGATKTALRGFFRACGNQRGFWFWIGSGLRTLHSRVRNRVWLNTSRMNTRKTAAKRRTLAIFRMNTYARQGR